jgi:uncharacterized protein (TIGR02145 family)
VAEYASATQLVFTGTPPYEVVLELEEGGTITQSISSSPYVMPASYTMQSFTDYTGAPGILKCELPVVYALSGSDVCAGTDVTLSLSGSQSGWQYQLYKDDEATGNPVAGTGSVLTFTDASATGTFGYMVQGISSTGAQCEMPASNAHNITVYSFPAAGTVSGTTICSGGSAELSVTLGAGTTTSMTYTWDVGGTSSTTTSASGKILPSLTASTSYTVQVRNAHGCVSAVSAPATITVYPAFTAGAISSGSTTALVSKSSAVTVTGTVAASGGDGDITYQWRRSGTGSATLTGSASSYALGSDAVYSAAGTYIFKRYAHDATCNVDWVASSGAYYLEVLAGVVQPQGNCTYTEPAPVGTFENFHTTAAYTSSTYTSLVDARDGKIYPVVKINSRWWMARNLNYQVGLTYWDKHGSPNGTSGSNSALRGGFWCPSNSSSTISRTVCDYWGALYAWETAMMLDGKGTWTEASGSYCTGAATTTNCKINFGRKASSGTTISGRGICPPNWHVPTDFELGVLMDGMESGGGTVHQNASGSGWYGSNAGTRGKAKCSGSSSDTNPTWSSGAGTDNYNFRGLAADDRNGDGSMYPARGGYSLFWSSSANSGSDAWYRQFTYDHANARQNATARSYGNSIRCVRD